MPGDDRSDNSPVVLSEHERRAFDDIVADLQRRTPAAPARHRDGRAARMRLSRVHVGVEVLASVMVISAPMVFGNAYAVSVADVLAETVLAAVLAMLTIGRALIPQHCLWMSGLAALLGAWLPLTLAAVTLGGTPLTPWRVLVILLAGAAIAVSASVQTVRLLRGA